MKDEDEADNDCCPICAAAEPTDLSRLFVAVNASLTGCQLSSYENFGALRIAEGKLDLRKLLALPLDKKLYTRPDGREQRTPELPRR